MTEESVTHHRYSEGVLVEVVIDDGDGDVRTLSIECDFGGDERRLLVPRDGLPDRHERHIRDHLENAGYRLERASLPP